MRAALACLGGVAAGLAAAPARAQYFTPPPAYYPPPCPVRVAPDMCGGYFYVADGSTLYGPNYYVYPPFPPFNGMVPPPTSGQHAAGPQGGAPGGAPGTGKVAPPSYPWTRGRSA